MPGDGVEGRRQGDETTQHRNPKRHGDGGPERGAEEEWTEAIGQERRTGPGAHLLSAAAHGPRLVTCRPISVTITSRGMSCGCG